MSGSPNKKVSSNVFTGSFKAQNLYAGSSFSADIQNFVQDDGHTQFGDIHGNHLSGNARDPSRRLQILESLRFPEMDARLNSIPESHTETFEWLFKDASIVAGESLDAPQADAGGPNVIWDNFTEWLKGGEEIYLIGGKAGSGKSTLMSFIYNHQKVQELLPCQDGSSALVLCHFFWLAGDVLQRAYKGLLATLSSQVIEHADDPTVEIALKVKFARSQRSLADWSESALENLLFSLLSALQDTSLVLIDGLDEFNQDDRPSRLVALLNRLTSCSGVKLCVSSRPIIWLGEQLSSAKRLELQDLTHSDILKYAKDVLQDEVGFYAR